MIEKLENIIPTLSSEDQQASLKQAIQLGIPSMKMEEWKYTYFQNILKNGFGIQTQPADTRIDTELVDAFSFSPNRIVFVDGKFHAELSHLEVNPKISFWNSANPEKSNSKDFLLELNNALATSGIFLDLADNLIMDQPIEIIYVTTPTGNIIQQKNQVRVGRNVQAQFIEYYINTEERAAYINNVTKLDVGESSHIHWYKIQDAGPSLHITDHLFAEQAEKSTASFYTNTVSSGIIRNVLHISINGERAETNMYGLYLLNGNEHADNRTQVDHKVPNCNSNELYKGIVGGNATGVFNGKIIVHKDAQKTNAFQSNKNILLSDDANVYTKPQLEIYADDVKCSHGATIAQIEDSELFYLRSRGLSKETAKSWLQYAFALDILENTPNETIKKLLEKRIAEKLNIDL
jgi:Fe-S cluster assembly protein SufD